MKAEFLPTIPGVLSFNKAIAKTEVLNLENTKILVIGYKDLIESKSSSNRLKDQADIEELKKRRKGAG